MKYLLFGIYLFTLTFSQNAYTQYQPDEVLLEVSKKLNGLKAFRYDLSRELNYASQDYKAISEWSGYYDYSLEESPLLFSFQVEDDNSKNIYNGAENFILDKSNKGIEIKEDPGKMDMKGFSFFL